VQEPYEVEEDLFSLLQETALFLWGGWPKNMQLSWYDPNKGHFKIWGECPHCSPVQSAFETVTQPFVTQMASTPLVVGVCRCIACRKFILAALHAGGGEWEYAFHYPLGKPNDDVSEHIPENVRNDFKEALRCQWTKAYNATAEMCRRAVETACLDLGAPYDEVLENMIDYLEANKTITPGLKDVAHNVRLAGNRGAHPWKVGQAIAKPIPVVVIEEPHAKAIVNFTQHFLESVYVIPKQLTDYDFRKPKAEKK
jgi:hypothetical protein